jgi:hypothetical protein
MHVSLALMCFYHAALGGGMAERPDKLNINPMAIPLPSVHRAILLTAEEYSGCR